MSTVSPMASNLYLKICKVDLIATFLICDPHVRRPSAGPRAHEGGRMNPRPGDRRAASPRPVVVAVADQAHVLQQTVVEVLEGGALPRGHANRSGRTARGARPPGPPRTHGATVRSGSRIRSVSYIRMHRIRSGSRMLGVQAPGKLRARTGASGRMTGGAPGDRGHLRTPRRGTSRAGSPARSSPRGIENRGRRTASPRTQAAVAMAGSEPSPRPLRLLPSSAFARCGRGAPADIGRGKIEPQSSISRMQERRTVWARPATAQGPQSGAASARWQESIAPLSSSRCVRQISNRHLAQGV